MSSYPYRAATALRPQQQGNPQISSPDSNNLDQSVPSAPAVGIPQTQVTVTDIDAEAHLFLLEDVYEEPDANTGAFQMQGPRLLWVPEAGRPYATDSSRVDEYIAKEEKRRERAANKGDQLRRNGLASGADDALKPTLAIQNGVPPKVEARRRAAAQKAINQYSYESSEDEANPTKRKYSRLERLKQTLARHEQPYGDIQKEDAVAPAKAFRGKGKQMAVEITEDAEQHSGDEERDAAAPAMTTRGSLKRKTTEILEDAEEQEPKRLRLDPSPIDLTEMGPTMSESAPSNVDDTLQEYQELMARPAPETEQLSPEDDPILTNDDDFPDFRTLRNNPERPDFGLSFKAGLEQAFAKEKKDQVYENSEVFFDARMDEDEDEELEREEAAAYSQGRPRVRRPRTVRPRATAAPRPQTSAQVQVQLPPGPPLRITRVYVAPKYSVMEYCMARILGTTCGFENGWVVRLFDQHMRGDGLALPIRSQESLLIVSATKPEEYFGTDPKGLEVATEVLEYFGV